MVIQNFVTLGIIGIVMRLYIYIRLYTFKSVLENQIKCSDQLKKTFFDVAWKSASDTKYNYTSQRRSNNVKILDQRLLLKILD